MITTGIPYSNGWWDLESGIKTEVVDVVSGKTCADLANFPLTLSGAVGANLQGTPIVCGGRYSTYFQKCYKFTDGGWQEFVSMKEKRGKAAGVVHSDKFHVFGGFDGYSRSQTTEIISIDGGVEYGPQIPASVFSHSITSINETVSILSGGSTGTSFRSPLTWYFNHMTQAFSGGPILQEGIQTPGRKDHGSGTLVDKVTKEKIAVVTGGFASGVYLDSTELLINGQWQPGTIQCQKKGNMFSFCPMLFVQHERALPFYFFFCFAHIRTSITKSTR